MYVQEVLIVFQMQWYKDQMIFLGLVVEMEVLIVIIFKIQYILQAHRISSMDMYI